MAFKLADLFVSITGNAKPLNATLGTIHKSLTGLSGIGAAAGGSLMRALGGALGATALLGGAGALGGLVTGLYQSVKASSDLNEQLNKAGEVFGKSTSIVTEKAQEMADKFGVPKTQFIDAASSIGLIVKASGMGENAAAKLGAQFSALAADVSSFYNVPVAKALEDIQAGLVGEARPMRQYGVLLSEEAVKAEAARLGLAKLGTELTEGQKVQARTSLITKGLATAQGDLARTASGAANSMREVWGRLTNAGAALGDALMPVFDSILRGANTALKGMSALFTSNASTIQGWAMGAMGVFQSVQAVLGRFVSALGSVAAAFLPAYTTAAKFTAELWGGLAGGLLDTISGLIERNAATFASWGAQLSEYITSVIGKVTEFGAAVGRFFGSESVKQVIAFAELAAWKFIQFQIDMIGTTFRVIGQIVSATVETLIFTMNNWDNITKLVGIGIGETLTHIGEYFNWLMDTAGKFLGWFQNNWVRIGKDAFNAWLTMLQNLGKNLAAMGQALVDFLRNPAGGLHIDWTPMLEGFKATVDKLPEIAAPAFSDFSEQYAEIFDAIAGDEAKRAAKKVGDAVAVAKGEAAAPGAGKRETLKPEETPTKGKKETGFTGLEEWAKKLQTGAFKDAATRATEQTAANTGQLVAIQKKSEEAMARWRAQNARLAAQAVGPE